MHRNKLKQQEARAKAQLEKAVNWKPILYPKMVKVKPVFEIRPKRFTL